MRVLHLASGREWRGGQRQTLLLAQGLARRTGITQTVVTGRGSELARRLEASGIAVRVTGWHMGIDPRALVTAWRAARYADLIHAHDPHAVAIAAAVARLTGRPFVATRRMNRPLRRPGPWRQAAKVIAISNAVRDSLYRSGIAPDRIVVIPPAIEVERTAETRPADWKPFGLAEPGSVAVAVAALTPEKGIDVLIEAATRLHRARPELHWVIAGGGPERRTLEARTMALNAGSYVHFLGQLRDPLPVIAAATVFVLPSREEGFGSIILDALALGIPVIATAVGGIPEALGGGGGILVPPGDAPALARVVESIESDPARRMQLSQEARRAVKHFDLGPMVDRVSVLYRSVEELLETQ
ncbi:MAG TPA: glycosyltransferase [Gemmatimonadales bacterium]|nr:glycosyltransferase [Gemmatimonadales bacterium]